MLTSSLCKQYQLFSAFAFCISRSASFLERLYGNDITYSGPMEEEEYEYMCTIACDLLKQQVETCPDNEKWYFENLVKGYSDYIDIIEMHIAKNNEAFVNFLKVIKAINTINSICFFCI